MLFGWLNDGLKLRERLSEMLAELEEAYFEVVLIPANEPKHSGHCIRALQYANPKWYSNFCAEYTNCRGKGRKRMKRARTFIKNQTALKALRKLVAGKTAGIYAERLLDYAKRQIENEKRIAAYREEEYFADIPF